MRRSPLLEERFVLPEKFKIVNSLLSGTAMFGVGWGLSGYCAGPALVSLVTGNPSVIVFVISMIVGQKQTQSLVDRIADTIETDIRLAPKRNPPTSDW